MTFERIFEASASRVVMIGLFLALLELIREKLVWAEQTARSSSIYLRPLTDENPEQAVRKAIIAIAEAENERLVPAGQQKQDIRLSSVEAPPIPISQVPSERKSTGSLEEQKQPAEDQIESGSIPITELSPPFLSSTEDTGATIQQQPRTN